MATTADGRSGGGGLSPELDPDVARDAIEHCYAQGWSDGLPVVPATEPLVERFLAQTSRAPDEVLWRMDHLGRECTVRTAAINAVMAGCLPEYFPVVLAAWEAVQLDRAARGGGWQSTSGPSPMIVVNGPIRERLGLNCTGGVFAAGFRPNATIPRAIGLMIRNAFGIVPHVFDQATQGLPGRFAICFGENEEESPWEPLAQSTGLPAGADAVSATLLRTCEYVDNRHTQDAEQLLWDFSDTMARSGALLFASESVGLVFCPEHAQMLSGAGYSRADVKTWFVEHCAKTAAELHRAGKYAMSGGHGVRSGTDEPVADPDELTHILSGPEAVPIVVAGARNAAMSMVVRVFGEWSNQSVAIESAPTSQGA